LGRRPRTGRAGAAPASGISGLTAHAQCVGVCQAGAIPGAGSFNIWHVPRSDVHSAEPAPDGETLSTLLRRYGGAGEPLSCEPLSQGLLNRGYRLATTRGRFFLKHHLNADRAAIAYHHRVTLGLGALGVPVAPPAADADGHTVAVIGGRCFALHPWVEGRHRDGGELSASQSWRLGALLGLVHTSLEQVIGSHPPVLGRSAARRSSAPAGTRVGPRRPYCAGPANSGPESAEPNGTEPNGTGPGRAAPDHMARTEPAQMDTEPAQVDTEPAQAERAHAEPDDPDYVADPDPRYSADPAHTFTVIERLLALARTHRPRDAFDELAEHRLVERRALVKRHAHRRPEADAVPATGWVHGDFHPLNLLYRDTEPAAIVDWDRLGLQPRAEEVVRAAAIFFVRPGGTLDLAKVRPFARAYRCAARTGSAEMAAAVHRVWWERINDFWMLRWRYQHGDRRADPQFPAVAALAVWWTREYTAVRDSFCD
jgi:Ser/Thr protein kinase RdoA (MazF antagonist)